MRSFEEGKQYKFDKQEFIKTMDYSPEAQISSWAEECDGMLVEVLNEYKGIVHSQTGIKHLDSIRYEVSALWCTEVEI